MAVQTQIAGAKVVDGEIAAQKALASIRYGEGPRVGFLGDTRCGKTEAMKHFIALYLRSCNGVVLIADDKYASRAQYAGQLRRDPDQVESGEMPIDPAGPRVVVYRGQPAMGARGTLDLESIARQQWKLAGKGRPSVAVYDELDRACKGGQWIQQPSDIGWTFGKGGGDGIGDFWGLQETESAPREPFNCSTHIVVVRCVGNPVRLLAQRGYCEPRGGVERVIPQLPGDPETPPAERGYFVLLARGRPWDGLVYRFRKRAAQPAPTVAR